MAALWRLDQEGGKGRRLLDCGSGEGHLVAEAARRGYEAVGMEIAEAAVRRARSGYSDLDFIMHSVEERPWPVQQGTFDVVVSFELIEHLLTPRELLLGANEALRPGGMLALTTPYHGLIKNLALAVAAFDRHFDVEGPHIRFFSDKALCRMLAEVGFEVEDVLHFGRFRWVWQNTFVWARKR
jgi:2-polyprenyl-3-methyl-5-hydroxy-6-metoxy-1,4-benzoquinol methylase